jgi:hypothetical protein
LAALSPTGDQLVLSTTEAEGVTSTWPEGLTLFKSERCRAPASVLTQPNGGPVRPCHETLAVITLAEAFPLHLDPATPAHGGTEAARHLSNSLHLIFETGSHDDTAFRPCMDEVFEAFYRTGTVEGLDTSCALVERPLRFAIDR